MAGRRRQNRRPRNRAGKICVSCMVVVMAAILSFQILRLHNQNQAYLEQKELLEEQLTEEESYAAELEAQEDYIGSDEYVEDIARTKLGMVYYDEIVFKEQ